MADRDRRWVAVYAHRDRLLRLARARLDDPHDAEDCVQEAMLRCVEFDRLDEARLGQFLTTVTVRLCADVHRARARGDRLARRLTGFWGTEPGHEESVCDRAESAWLSSRLESLTPNQRAIVEARAEGLSCGAVAERLTVSYTTVESALARVRRSLRVALDSTLGLAPPGWLWARRALAGTAVAAAAVTTFTGDVDLPERAPLRPPAAAPERPATAPPPEAASPAVVAATPPGRVAGVPARRSPRAAARGTVAVPAAAPGRDRDGTDIGTEDGRPVVSTYTSEHPYDDHQRVMHCVRYGVAVGYVVQCRYPPGDPRNIEEDAGTPTPERRKP